jgi:thiamine-phosphate pyrophosphorylase
MELYIITDERLIARGQFTETVEYALRGGATWVQFREKHSSHEERLRLGAELRDVCKQYGAKLIVNDSPELAKEIVADGVHLGKDDGSVAEARTILGKDAIIGVSCYNDFSLALKAEQEGADYVAFGSFFPSQIKPNAVRATLDLLSEAKAALKIPVCCIGGITPENASELQASGADMIAVCSAVFGADDPEEAAAAFIVEQSGSVILRESAIS